MLQGVQYQLVTGCPTMATGRRSCLGLSRKWRRLILPVLLLLPLLVLLLGAAKTATTTADEDTSSHGHGRHRRHVDMATYPKLREKNRQLNSGDYGRSVPIKFDIPVLVVVKSEDSDVIKRSLASLQERTMGYNTKIYLAPIYSYKENIRTILKQFPFELIENDLNSRTFSMDPFSIFGEFASNTFSKLSSAINSKIFEEMDELFLDCSGFGNDVKTTLKYLNRKINKSELVEFRPKLADRSDAHDYFTANHNNEFSPQYQTCFKNSYEHFKQQQQLKYRQKRHNLTATIRNFNGYLLEEANVEIMYPLMSQNIFSEIAHENQHKRQLQEKFQEQSSKKPFETTKEHPKEQEFPTSKVMADNSGPLPFSIPDFLGRFQDRQRKCGILRRFKNALRHLLENNQEKQEFVILGDDQLFATDFVSFFRQTRTIFSLDPSVYCVSMGNPLYPAFLPKMVLNTTKNKPKTAKNKIFARKNGSEKASKLVTVNNRLKREHAKRTKEIPQSEFNKIPSETALRRVDHFLFKGATMVNRKLLEEIIEKFVLPPFPSTRSFPRPKDFIPKHLNELKDQENEKTIKMNKSTNFKNIKNMKITKKRLGNEIKTNDHLNYVSKDMKVNYLRKKELEETKKIIDDFHSSFDILHSVTEWSSWYRTRRLRGCVYPTQPRVCHLPSVMSYKPHPLAADVSTAASANTYVSWDLIKSRLGRNNATAEVYYAGAGGGPPSLMVDYENCIRRGETEVTLMDLTKLVRHRYYKRVFQQMFHAQYIGINASSNCTTRDFYPRQYKMGAAYVVHIKMISYSDDYTLRTLLQCFGIVPSEAGIVTGSSSTGQFDGVFQVITVDGTVIYVMAVPLARLTPELPSVQVVSAVPGSSVGVVITPYREFRDSNYRWKPVTVVSTDDFVSPTNNSVLEEQHRKRMKEDEEEENELNEEHGTEEEN